MKPPENFIPGKVRPAWRDEWAAAGTKMLFVDKGVPAEDFGRIAHVAAVAGVTKIIVPENALDVALSEIAWTAAAGTLGRDAIHLYSAENLHNALGMFRERFFVVGLVREGGRRIDYAKQISFPGKPVALYLSGDENGVPAENISRCDYLLHIPEPAGTAFRFNVPELAAHVLPWLFAKNKKKKSTFMPHGFAHD